MGFSSSQRLGAVCAAVMFLAACAGDGPTQVEEVTAVSHTSSGPVLIECPIDSTRSVTQTLGLLGGSLEIDGHSLNIPFGAVLLPTQFTITVPASRFMEVHVTANGQHGFEFLETVGMTISYERCSRSNINTGNLTVYKVDTGTKALLKHMGGSDDTLLRRVTFSSDSLSGYAIAQ